MIHNAGFGRVGIAGIDRNVGNWGSVGFGNIDNGGSVGKFRLQLLELTSFKPKLLIRFIMNKPC